MATSRYERYQYIYGNNARTVEVEVEEPVRKQRETQQRTTQRKVKSNPRVLEFSGRFTATVGLSVAALVFICVTYLNGQHQLNNQISSISAKRAELTSLINENHALASNLDKKVNYDEIRTYAEESLGMVAPNEGNTIYYEGTSSDYVRQYAEIPAMD